MKNFYEVLVKSVAFLAVCTVINVNAVSAQNGGLVDLTALLVSAVQEVGADASVEEVQNTIEEVLSTVEASPTQILDALTALNSYGLVNKNVVALASSNVASNFGTGSISQVGSSLSVPANALPSASPTSSAASSPAASAGGGGSGYVAG